MVRSSSIEQSGTEFSSFALTRSNPQDRVCHTPPMSAQGVGVSSVRLVALRGLGQIRPGDDLVGMLTRAIRAGDHPVAAGDIVVVTQKIVSKSEGALVALDDVAPSARAEEWARAWEKDPRATELVLRESVRLVRVACGVCTTA